MWLLDVTGDDLALTQVSDSNDSEFEDYVDLEAAHASRSRNGYAILSHSKLDLKDLSNRVIR